MFKLNRGSFARNSAMESVTYSLLQVFVISTILRVLFGAEFHKEFEVILIFCGVALTLARIIYDLRNFKKHVALRVIMDEIGPVDISEKMIEELYKQLRHWIKEFREATKVSTAQYGATLLGQTERLYSAGQIVGLISPDNTWEAFLDEELWCSDEREDYRQN